MEFVIVTQECQNAVKVPPVRIDAIDITDTRRVNQVDCDIVHFELILLGALSCGFAHHQLLIIVRISYQYFLFNVLIHEHES